MTPWNEFLDEWMARRERNAAWVANAAGYHKSLITGWRRGMKPSVEYVRATAVALDAPVVQAMVAAGYLEPGDVKSVEIERPLTDLADDELLREIRRRMTREPAANNVTPLRSVDQGDSVDDAPPPAHLAKAARTEAGYTKSGDRGKNPTNE